jgi:acetylcholinesterase
MIWIPGGGFVGGSPTSVAYNGQYFADQEDVIIVSVR